ncbi:uncharacterized protein LOC114312148 [Camellia sinensis]|uniref:uncharacterized protein LOC114312148 n=1 Tax=Camellia sinensis TaxID=4442 RepID=UPI001035F3E7|nr:uncharacterized protein LOC114312148 [Camellia sinensis]
MDWVLKGLNTLNLQFSDLYPQEGLDLLLNLTLVDSDYSYCFKALIMFLVIAEISTSVLSNESSRIPFLNGDNFSNWKDKILLTLGCMDLDLALRVDEPPEPTDESSAAEKSAYDKWERSNRLSLMLIKSHISQSIRGLIPPSDKVKNYMRAIEEQFVSSDKALASTLMNKLSGMKHNNSRSVCKHIMEMRDIAARLKSLEIEISESFLVNFILNSLPVEYEAFQISYNTQKEKWSINELLTMCVQEEERLKHGKVESAHLATHKGGQWKKGKGDQKWKKLGKVSF